MSQTERTDLLARHAKACEYPGVLDAPSVERHLRDYLAALGVQRTVVQLRAGWELEDHPALERQVTSILEDFQKRSPARDALDALDARAARAALDARAALAARDARDALALHRFAEWCLYRTGWSWWWDLAWITTTLLGAVELKRPAVEQWSRPLFEAFVAGAWFLHWTDDTLYWIAKPVVHLDTTPNTRRLHNDQYAALESDVENLYFWHGILVPAFVVVRPDWITAKHVLTEDNAEVRRVMLERMGMTRFLLESGATAMQQDDCGALYRIELAGDEPVVLVHVTNATPEPDGSLKKYVLRVPPDMTRARAAVAWTFGLREEQYQPTRET